MKIAVYCGSGFGRGEQWREAAKRLGAWIGEQGHTLVYGGGEAGLMGEVAQAAFSRGSRVIGVVPGNVEFIRSRPQPYCTEVQVMANMSARKQRMLELADAFVALPGGIGTLDEITEAITLTRIGVFRKPAVLVNTADYYAHFRQMLADMAKAGFIEEALPYVLFSDDMTKIADFLDAFRKE